MSDFKSHLPVQTHKDGASFVADSEYAVAIGGFESTGGTFEAARISANREIYVFENELRAAVKAEDSAHTSGDKGSHILAVRMDTRASMVDADGDYSSFQLTSTGDLRVKDDDANTKLSAIQTAVQLIDDVIFAEDAAHTSGDKGAHILAVRQDTLASLASDDGDYASLKVDAQGRLYTKADVTFTIERAEDAAHASGDKGLMMLGVRNDASAIMTSDDGDYSALTVDASGALRVTITDPSALSTEVRDYNTSASVAVAGSANHDYTVSALKTLKAKRMFVSASGRIKASLILDPSGTPETIVVGFNSTASPLIDIDLEGLVEVAAGIVVRIVIENLDEDAQDVYSTLFGNEI